MCSPPPNQNITQQQKKLKRAAKSHASQKKKFLTSKSVWLPLNPLFMTFSFLHTDWRIFASWIAYKCMLLYSFVHSYWSHLATALSFSAFSLNILSPKSPSELNWTAFQPKLCLKLSISAKACHWFSLAQRQMLC